MMITICCVCNRTKKGEDWLILPMPLTELPSHGYCPECAAEVHKEIELLKLKKITPAEFGTGFTSRQRKIA